jgi:hypothetical protein
MQILFVISVLCFLAVVWGAIVFARHIKAGERRSASFLPAKTQFRQHLQPALDRVESDSSMLKAEAQFISKPVAAKDWREGLPQPALHQPALHQAGLHQAGLHQAGLHQSVQDITANKQWSMPPQPTRTRRLQVFPAPLENPTSGSNIALRKPPQATRHGNMELIDSAYFSKDLGDLTDPYEPHRLSVNARK